MQDPRIDLRLAESGAEGKKNREKGLVKRQLSDFHDSHLRMYYTTYTILYVPQTRDTIFKNLPKYRYTLHTQT